MTRERAVWLTLPAAAALAACVSLTPYELAVGRLPGGEFLDIDGTTVHIERTGAGAGSPIVLVHGFGGSTFSWRLVAPALATGHEVVAVDLRGFGLSERPGERTRYSRTAQVELLSALVERLGWTSAHFVGHSYGGGLVMSLAWTRPDRVRSLVLVASTAPDYGDRRRTALAVRPLASLIVRTLLRPRFVRRSLEHSFHDDAAVTDGLVASYLERVKIEGAVRAYVGLTAPAARDPRFTGLAYERLEQPALVIWGADDSLISPAKGREAADQLPRGRFVEIPGCGHLPMEEKPERLGAEILEFLEDVDAAASIPETGIATSH